MANPGDMERAEAEAIYDSGRDACVKVLLALANQVERLEGRVERLEGEVRELRRDSGNYLPGSCGQCGHSLAGRPARGPVRRHQVAELPETAIRVIEHRLHRRCCPGCGALTQAELPPEVGRERFGPRLQGPVATLAAGFRLSRRQVADLCGELFGLQIAVGTVDAIMGRSGSALREPQERLCDAVRSASVVCVDETSWKQAGERRFLWGAFTEEAAALRVAPSRHREEAERP